MVADRKADRHAVGNQTAVHARLDPGDFRRLEATRERLGIKSRRKAIITAIREWLDRNENSEDPHADLYRHCPDQGQRHVRDFTREGAH